MKNLFNLGVALVLILLALGAFWYVNPHLAPGFVRGLPEVKLRGPTVGFGE